MKSKIVALLIVLSSMVLLTSQSAHYSDDDEEKEQKLQDATRTMCYKLSVESQPYDSQVEVYFYPAFDEARIFFKEPYGKFSKSIAVVVVRDATCMFGKQNNYYHYRLISKDEVRYIPSKTNPMEIWYVRHVKFY